MSQRFRERETHLVGVELAGEEDRNEIRHRVRRFCACFPDPLAASFVMCLKFETSFMQPVERAAVSRQHQDIVRQFLTHKAQRPEKMSERVAIRFAGEDADIGRDPLDDLISSEQQPILLAVKKDLLGGMPVRGWLRVSHTAFG